MIRYFIKLLFQMVLILLCVSFLSFLLVYLAKGDPAESILNAQGIPYTKELLEVKRAEMGLNDSFILQYLRWLGNILQGNFGISYRTGAPVWDQLVFYFPNIPRGPYLAGNACHFPSSFDLCSLSYW